MEVTYVVTLTSGFERFEPDVHVGTVIFESKSVQDAATVMAARVITHPGSVVHMFEKEG